MRIPRFCLVFLIFFFFTASMYSFAAAEGSEKITCPGYEPPRVFYFDDIFHLSLTEVYPSAESIEGIYSRKVSLGGNLIGSFGQCSNLVMVLGAQTQTLMGLVDGKTSVSAILWNPRISLRRHEKPGRYFGVGWNRWLSGSTPEQAFNFIVHAVQNDITLNIEELNLVFFDFGHQFTALDVLNIQYRLILPFYQASLPDVPKALFRPKERKDRYRSHWIFEGGIFWRPGFDINLSLVTQKEFSSDREPYMVGVAGDIPLLSSLLPSLEPRVKIDHRRFGGIGDKKTLISGFWGIWAEGEENRILFIFVRRY